MNIIPDIILAVLLILGYTMGRKKGFLKSVWKIAALLITAIAVMVLKNPAVEFVSGTKAASDIYESVAAKVQLPEGGGVNITESLHLPSLLQPQIDAGLKTAQHTATAVNEAAAVSLTKIIILIAVCIALFIIIRLLLAGIYLILNGITKAPVIKGANRFLGGVLGAVNMAFIVLLALALFAVFAPADSGLYEMINHSYLVKYFYNYNILLQLFMKI